MNSYRSYEEDIYAWAQEQAAVLRRLASLRHQLPNELDLEHVAEEIEEVGISERNAAASFVRLIFVHLIRLAAAPEADAARTWRSEIVGFHNELLARLTKAMQPRIDLDLVWTRALREAAAALEADERTDLHRSALAKLVGRPFGFELLALEELDVDLALSQLVGTARHDPPRLAPGIP